MVMLLHPGPALPHPEVLEFPWWAYALGGAVVLLFSAWIAYDLRGAPGTAASAAPGPGPAGRSRRPTPAPAASDVILFGDEGLIAGRRPTSAHAGAAAGPAVALAPSDAPDEAGEAESASEAGRDATTFVSDTTLPNPVRLFALVLGLIATALAVEHVRAVEALAGFIRSSNADQVGRLGMAFVLLLAAGTALVVVRPRIAALCFAGSGIVGIFLATAERWQDRLRWWDASYVLDAWQFLPQWSVAAFALAGVALLGAIYQPRRPLPFLARARVADATAERAVT